MVRIMKFFAYTLFFISMLIYFMPKINAYYLLENTLKENSIIISDEELTDNGFSLDITNASVFVKSIKSANIQNINIKIFGFYNKISLKNITLSKTMKSFIPLHVEDLNIDYSIITPFSVNLNGVGEFGTFTAIFNIDKDSIKLQLNPSKTMLNNYKSTLKNLVKSENGEYIYEKNI